MMLYFDAYLKLSLVISFWCVGFFLACEEGKILHFVRQRIYAQAGWLSRLLIGSPKHFREEWYSNKVSKWTDYICAPIIGCCPCMASIHSAIFYVGYLSYFQVTPNWWNFVYLLIIIFTVTVFNTVLITIVNFIRSLCYIADKFADAIEKEEKEEQ